MIDDDPIEPAANSVGGMLEDARHRADLTVTDVAERTRIRAGIIRDIERDDFTSCGGTFYARGHVKSLVAALGLDRDSVLATFDRTHDHTASRLAPDTLPGYPPHGAAAKASTKASTKASAKAGAKAGGKEAGPRWASLMIGVVALVAVIIVVGVIAALVHRPDSPSPHTAPHVSPSAAGQSSRPTGRPTTTSAPTFSPAPSSLFAPSSVTLLLSVTARSSWVRVISSAGRQLFEGVLHPGDAKAFSDPTALTVRYGNAPAVRVELNGQLLAGPGCDRAVCTMIYPVNAAPSQSPH